MWNNEIKNESILHDKMIVSKPQPTSPTDGRGEVTLVLGTVKDETEDDRLQDSNGTIPVARGKLNLLLQSTSKFISNGFDFCT
jgi:hypothetical protein